MSFIKRFGASTRKPRLFNGLALVASLFLLLSLAGCGGGSSSTPTAADNGTVVVGLTDAEGDFLTYTVDVLSIKMTHANGRVVETLPLATRVDFAQYTDLTEFLTAATVPLGDYKEAVVTLDYSHAQIEVEGPMGEAVPVTKILDTAGKPVTTMEMGVQLDRNLPIAPGLLRYVMLDFDLAKSNTVTITGNAASITVKPELIASVEKEPAKQHRLRGPLKAVDVAGGYYELYIRPYFRRILNNSGSYGEFRVQTDSHTLFEIDGIPYSGSDGLAVLATKPQFTAVVAIGHLRMNPLRFEADEVRAGSSVPGGTLDVVQGSVIARSGDVLTLKGSTLIRSDSTVVFNDTVTVTVADSTSVTKQLSTGSHTIDEISVGQRIVAFGQVTNDSSADMQFSAVNGYVRMELSQVRGNVTAVPTMTGELLTLNLTAINGRNPALYHFDGTQASATSYEIDTGTLGLAGIATSDDVAVRGFPTPFGTGPEDFSAQTVIEMTPSALP